MNSWSGGLFTVYEPNICTTSLCFPAVSYGIINQKLKYLRNRVPESCVPACLTYTTYAAIGYYLGLTLGMIDLKLPFEVSTGIATVCSSCYTGLVSFSTRTRIREKYNIEGSKFEDCMTHLLCMPCALSQEIYEIENN